MGENVQFEWNSKIIGVQKLKWYKKISGNESSKIFFKNDFIRFRFIPSFALGFSLSLKLVSKVSITSVMISLGGSLKKN